MMHALPCALVLLTAGAADTPPAELVARLGDPSFAVREQAAQALQRLGHEAVPALRAGQADPDPEVRRRCSALLTGILSAERQAQLKSFAQGKEDPRGPPAGWRCFARLVGDDAASRAVFLPLCQAEGELLDMVEKTPARAATAVVDRIGKFAGLCITPAQEERAVAEATLLIFLAAAGRVPLNQAHRDALLSGLGVLAHRPSVREAFLKNPVRRRLLLIFLRQTTGTSSQRALALAGALKFKESADWTLEVARDRRQSGEVRGWALLALGQVGGKEHCSAVKELLQDQTAVGTFRLGKQTLHTELRDVALATAIRLSRGQREKYGFPYWQALPGVEEVPQPSCLGFADAASREAAFRKWKKTQGGQP